jgi:hypothetical protein
VVTRIADASIMTIAQARASSCDCITADSPTDAILQTMIDQVSDDLAVVSGGALSGRQTVIARPCRTDCNPCPVCSCGCNLDTIPLWGDAVSDVEIKIDGDTLAAEFWWLHWDGIAWVVARKPLTGELGPRSWPSWQKRWLDDTEDDTFSITYTRGVHLDGVLVQNAAVEALCDYVSAERISATALDGIESITIGGATASVSQDRIERIASGQLGPHTRKLMGLLRPDGRSPSMVFAPELLGGWELNLAVV